MPPPQSHLFFFFNDTATTEIYTLSLHDALPIFSTTSSLLHTMQNCGYLQRDEKGQFYLSMKIVIQAYRADRKSTRLNSSHGYISYAVFCLKKKKNKINISDLTNKYLRPCTCARR